MRHWANAGCAYRTETYMALVLLVGSKCTRPRHSYTAYISLTPFQVALSVLEVIAQGWAFRSDRSTEIHRQPSSCNDTQTYHPLRNRGAWLCGIFYFVYQGVEGTC